MTISSGESGDRTSDQSPQCKRCGSSDVCIVCRGDPLCRECFTAYVQTKIVKRLEVFRVRNAAPGSTPQLCLPLSFGVSSSVLLYSLSSQLERQLARTGRPGFQVHVLHVHAHDEDADVTQIKSRLESAKQQFPAHSYHLESTNTVSDEETALSATSRADLASIKQTRMIVSKAKELGCDAILWGDSTTRLAEKVLAETAKGRGFALPWLAADGESPYGITFMYPMRDLLKKELLSFAELSSLPWSDLIQPEVLDKTSVSSKTTTIDGLMKDYFRSVEENYPSIVANVVRTSDKLDKTMPDSARLCASCGMPVINGPLGLDDWAGSATSTAQLNLQTGEQVARELCYGCARSVHTDDA